MSVAQQRGMMGTLKTFSRSSHKINDPAGKKAIKDYLDIAFAGKDLRTIENPDEHGIDLLTLNLSDEVVYCWEVEVRRENWKGDVPFPFRDINCLERKEHQWRREETFTSKIPYTLAKDYGICYVQLNDLCNRAVFIDSGVILEHPLKPWANRLAEGEYVRQVPLGKTKQVELK